MYKVILETSGKKHKAEGKDINEALSKMGLKWNDIKAKGVITVKSKNKSLEQVFYMGRLRKIFANKITRLMWSKRLHLLLKEQ